MSRPVMRWNYEGLSCCELSKESHILHPPGVTYAWFWCNCPHHGMSELHRVPGEVIEDEEG